ncbi:ankyrin repeat-containing domain protein, partial [Mycena rebaudengoi]
PALEWRITPLLGKELLLWAAGEAKPHILAKLLAPPHRIDACTTNFSDESALHMAVSAGSIECAALLLAHGADPMHSLAGEQPLHRAAQGNHLALAALLLDHGAPINDVKALIGSTRALPLHLACRHGHTDMVRLLLARGAHLEARGSDG